MIAYTSYAENLTRRILAGAGGLSLVPYRVDPQAYVSVLAHGVDPSGRVLVLCAVEDAELIGDTAVRVDSVKKALEFDVDITVASLHALAHISWLAEGEGVAGFGYHPISHLRVGVLELDTIYVRDPHGTTKSEFSDLMPGVLEAGASFDDLDARNEIGRLSFSQLSGLVAGVSMGVLPGFILSDREQSLCGAHQNRIWVADVDRHGVVLFRAGERRITTAMVRFPEQVDSLADLAEAVAALAEQVSV